MPLNEIRKATEERADNLAKGITKNPMGYLVVILLVIVFYLYKDNISLRDENVKINSDYLTYLKSIKTQLQIIVDTTGIKQNK